jgi:AAA domain
MLRLDKVIKPWKEAAALNDHINLYGFWNETVFLTKSGDVGMVLRVASGEFQIVEHSQSQPARQFTTAKTIEAEHEIVRRVREGENTLEPVMSRQQAIAVTDQNTYLNRAQKSVVEDVLSSPDRVQGVQGYAGAGKTTTLSVIRGAAELNGYAVEGFAPTSRAARQLGEAGVESGTLQGFLARSPNPVTQHQRHFYFVDESSLASTNQMREFLARLGPNDRVLLIGDIRQHQGVEADHLHAGNALFGGVVAHVITFRFRKNPQKCRVGVGDPMAECKTSDEDGNSGD